MSDNEDWRRRKAEELGLVDTGPWMSRPALPPARAALHRAPDASAVRPPAQGNAAERNPTPIRKLSDIPDDAIYIDCRRRVHPRTRPAQSASSPAAASPGSAWHRRGTRAATMLALVAGLALALVLGWWLRGTAAPAYAPLVVPATAAQSSGGAAPAVDSEPASSDALAAADAEPGTMVDTTPELAQARIPSSVTPPLAEYAPAALPTTSAALPPAASSPRDDGSAAAAQNRSEYARRPVATGERPASRPDSPGQPGASLSAARGRFTAPRAVAASGRDFRPSFNCRRATSWVNRIVCNNEELAALDVQMSDAYGGAIAAAGPADERRIDTDQARFLGQRARCRTAACVERAYRIRIDDLTPSN